jgi:hypothetical protein
VQPGGSLFGHNLTLKHMGASGPSSRRKETADPSTTLPRISCRISWVRRASCGFLYGKPHTRSCLHQRSRKSGYAPVGMTKESDKCHRYPVGKTNQKARNQGLLCHPDRSAA